MKRRAVVFLCVSVFVGLCLILTGTKPRDVIDDRFNMASSLHQDALMADFRAYKQGHLLKHYFSANDLDHRFNISVNGSDVLNLLRIQKTGSTTMDNHLIQNLDLRRWCDCDVKSLDQCECYTEWKKKVLFKQHKDDWPCGLHADWTYLHECVRQKQKHAKMKQRHLYLTVIRDPVRRFISEWRHVARGAIWRRFGEPFICRGKRASEQEIPLCYVTQTWEKVSLDDFMACSSNMAINRQTRMLASLDVVNCYNTSGMTYKERHVRMLNSAKENLLKMAFFGVTDHQVLTQILFEYTFNLKFINEFVDSPDNETFSGKVDLDSTIVNKIVDLNKYDVILYEYAKDLFIQRLFRVAKYMNNLTIRETIHNKLKSVKEMYS